MEHGKVEDSGLNTASGTARFKPSPANAAGAEAAEATREDESCDCPVCGGDGLAFPGDGEVCDLCGGGGLITLADRDYWAANVRDFEL